MAIDSLLAKEPVKNWFACRWQGCGFESVKKINAISHIQAKHVPGFPGYQCNLCQKHCPTSNAFVRHNQRFHKSNV